MKNPKTLNIISTVLLIIGIIGGIIISLDNEISWALFPGDSALIIFPLLFLASLIFAVISYKKERTIFNIILLIISGLSLIFIVLLFTYAYGLGSGWNH